MKLHDYGDRAVLIETDHVVAVRNHLLAQAHPNISAVVPAARTVLVEFTGRRPDLARLLAQIEQLDSGGFATHTGADSPLSASTGSAAADTVLELAVYYDGADLAAVADRSGLSSAEVVRRHADREYVVQFCGFSPGFGYLTGLDEQLKLPRRGTPRTSVPAGSVAIADEFTGIYPRASPGGWHLLGHTEASLFDVQRDPPALLTPGRRVRFVPQ